jgi:dTDP-4-amino-4,6-dideoxygalactose transaminase
LGEIVKEPYAIKEGFHTYNQYTVRVPLRDELQAYLKECGIGTAIYYPLPLHLQPSFVNLGYKAGDFPESERACGEVISLPVFPEITLEQQVYVADMIKAFYKGKGLI